MDWKEVGLQFVKKGLPLLGGLIGGPAGSLGAQAAISLVSSALGKGEAEITPESVVKTISANPESLVELRKLEMQHKERLQEFLLEERKLELQDVANARQRSTEVVKATGKIDYFQYGLATVITVGFFSLTALMYFKPIPEASLGPINQLFGALVLGFGSVIGYFFGSSKGSSDKNKLFSNTK